MTYKSYKDVEPEIIKARNEFGADKLIEGKVIGKQEGLIEGEKNRTIEIVKEMLAQNSDIDFIVKVTKLTKEEIIKIKKDVK